jgi:predicted RNase H-like HicB family nuclease
MNAALDAKAPAVLHQQVWDREIALFAPQAHPLGREVDRKATAAKDPSSGARLNYPALLTAEGNRIVIKFPDCPGCQTSVEKGEHPLPRAQEALTGWLQVVLESGEAPPRPFIEKLNISGGERLLVVPIPDELARALRAPWKWHQR